MLVAVQEIHSLFAINFAEGALVDMEQNVFEGELALTFGTRFFTPTHVCKNETAEPLGRSIDPFGLLLKAVGNRGKHLHENKVLYYEHKPWSKSKK